jgi:hypothetical protein
MPTPLESDPKQRVKRLLVPSTGWLLWSVALAAMWDRRILSRAISADGDLAQHVTLGRLMLERRGLLPVDPTLYTVGSKRFIAHEWLSEVLFGALHSWLGLNGPAILVTLLVATALLVLWHELEAQGPAMWTQVATLGCVLLLVQTHFLIRPHVFTWLLALVWQHWLTRWLDGRYTLRQLLSRAVPTMVLWCNLHGGFILGFLLLGVAGLWLVLRALTDSQERRAGAWAMIRSLAVASVVVLLASGINPFGFSLHRHVVGFFVLSPVLAGITEFQSPDFRSPSNAPLLLWIVLSFSLAASCRGEGRLRDRLLQLVLLSMTLQSQRNAVLFGLLTAPTVSRDLDEWTAAVAEGDGALARVMRRLRASSERLAEQDRRHDGRIWALLALGLPLYHGLFDPGYVEFSPKLQPIGAVAHIQQHPSRFRGRMLNAYGWGGYLAYALYPEHRCFINGLNDYYGPKLLEDHLQVVKVGVRFREVLRRYGIEWLVVERSSKLAHVLPLLSDWRLDYRDAVSVIYVRNTGSSAGGSPATTAVALRRPGR